MARLLAIVGGMCVCTGCAAPLMPGTPSLAPLLAIRYELLAGASPSVGEKRAELSRDFQQIRAAGFNAVWLDFATEDDRAAAAEVAADLRIIVAEPSIDRYIRFGKLPSEFPSPQRLVLARAGPLFQARAPSILALPPFPSGELADRAGEIARIAADLQPPGEVLIVGHAADAARFSHLPTVWYAARLTPDTPFRYEAPSPRVIPILGADSTAAAWSERAIRLAYSRGLDAGLTDGLLVWRFRCWPGESNGLAESDGRLTPAAVTAIKSVLARAAQWICLSGARCIAEGGVRIDSTKLRCTSYRRHARRFVLVHNEDPEHFGHGVLRVPPILAGAPVSRVVAQDTGARHVRSEGPLMIPIHLAPAEAILFEIH